MLTLLSVSFILAQNSLNGAEVPLSNKQTKQSSNDATTDDE